MIKIDRSGQRTGRECRAMNEHTSAAPFAIPLSTTLWQCQALAISPSCPDTRGYHPLARARSILNKLARIALKPNSISNVNQQFHSTFVRVCVFDPLSLSFCFSLSSVATGWGGRKGDGGVLVPPEEQQRMRVPHHVATPVRPASRRGIDPRAEAALIPLGLSSSAPAGVGLWRW